MTPLLMEICRNGRVGCLVLSLGTMKSTAKTSIASSNQTSDYNVQCTCNYAQQLIINTF